jgi:insertion element IS1 protein InsB
VAVQGLWPTNQFQTAARATGLEERNRCPAVHVGFVYECHWKIAGGVDPLDPELDPSPCRDARAAPATEAGRGRGRDGTGRTVALHKKKENKLWVWLAFDRTGRRLLDWECGDRDAITLNRLLERLKCWKVTLYCTDDYGPYDTPLPVGRHYIGKDQTVAIERVNSRLRHWFARFRRRTCVVSKAIAMVDVTIALFAAYHINGTGTKLTSPLFA